MGKQKRQNPQIRLSSGQVKWMLDYGQRIGFRLSLQQLARLAIDAGREHMPLFKIPKQQPKER